MEQIEVKAVAAVNLRRFLLERFGESRPRSSPIDFGRSLAGVLAMQLALACASPGKATTVAPPGQVDRKTLLITAPCVVHAGEATSTTMKARRSNGAATSASLGGSCSSNAECIRQHGRQTPGDGFVSLDCADRACTCTLEPLTAGDSPKVHHFELDAACTSTDRARELLVERCMAGMPPPIGSPGPR